MSQVKELYSYPIKSCAGTSHQSVHIDAGRLAYDREWMLADPQTSESLSQRKDPKLALVEPCIDTGRMLVTAPGMDTLSVDLDDVDYPEVGTNVWGHEAPAIGQSEQASYWFSNYLERPVKLVRKSLNSGRLVTPARQITGAFNALAFADGAPILLTTIPSLMRVNADNAQPAFPMNRFRPNIVIDANDPEELRPFDEDFWRKIEIAGIALFIAWACTRCSIIETDQTTAIRGKTIFSILRDFRRGTDATDPGNRGVFFGQNVVPAGEGIIRIGDDVRLKERAGKRNVLGLEELSQGY